MGCGSLATTISQMSPALKKKKRVEKQRVGEKFARDVQFKNWSTCSRSVTVAVVAASLVDWYKFSFRGNCKDSNGARISSFFL